MKAERITPPGAARNTEIKVTSDTGAIYMWLPELEARAVYRALAVFFESDQSGPVVRYADDSMDRGQGHVAAIRASLMGGPRAK